jgi:hypothetical protein
MLIAIAVTAAVVLAFFAGVMYARSNRPTDDDRFHRYDEL